MVKPALVRSFIVVLLSCFYAINAWAGKGGPKTASDYGSSADSPCSSTSNTFSENGVTATCYFPSTGDTTSLLFNFTVDSISNQVASFNVNSFELDLASTDLSQLSAFWLLYDCSSSSSSGVPLPCTTQSSFPPSLPFSVNGPSLPTVSDQGFDFSGFTGNLSGEVTVALDFDCSGAGASSSNLCSEFSSAFSSGTPNIDAQSLFTNIEAGTTPTPEPRYYALVAFGVILATSLFKRYRSRKAA